MFDTFGDLDHCTRSIMQIQREEIFKATNEDGTSHASSQFTVVGVLFGDVHGDASRATTEGIPDMCTWANKWRRP